MRFASEKLGDALPEARGKEQELLAQLHASDAELAAVADRLNALRQAQAAVEREAERHGTAIEAAERNLASAKKESLTELEARLAEVESEGEVAEPDSTERDELAVKARGARQKEMDERLAVSAAEEQAKSLTGRADALLRAARQERDARAKAKARAERRRVEAQIAAAVRDAATELSAMSTRRCSEPRTRATPPTACSRSRRAGGGGDPQGREGRQRPTGRVAARRAPRRDGPHRAPDARRAARSRRR